MTRFKYYTIYHCKNCGQYIRVHGKLASKLVLPSGVQMCCSRPRLVRERQVLISEYDEGEKKGTKQDGLGSKPARQKSLIDYSKKK